jgi:RNA polymerase-binding transcription factor DksA
MKTFDERMKRKIEKQLAILNCWIRFLKHECLANELTVPGDNTPSNDNLVNTEMSEEQESRLDLLERLVEKTTKLHEALDRIPDGLYGICTACAKPIHRERLETLPEADLCLKCHNLWQKFGGLKTDDCVIA